MWPTAGTGVRSDANDARGRKREYSTNPRLTASDVLLAVYTQGSTGVLGRYWGAQIPFLLVPRMITAWAEHGIREHGFRE